MVELEGLFFQYPDSQFQLNIDELDFARGSKTALIGTSGYGKTTFLNIVAGIITPQKGTVKVGDEIISALGDAERRNFRIRHIGFIFQDFKLIPYLNVMDNILLPYRINSSIRMNDSTWQSALSIAEELGIGNKMKKYPDKLSQGERQRVAICRALLNRPSLILADEPTGNLDPENKQRIMDILFDSVEKFESTLITVTHDHDMLEGFETIIDFKNFQAL